MLESSEWKMYVMKNQETLDEMRWRIQKSLAESKRQQLRDEFGMQMDYTSPTLSPKAENKRLDYILKFERQFENVKPITVREQIGNGCISNELKGRARHGAAGIYLTKTVRPVPCTTPSF
jgi:hypothetical protein